MFGTAGMRWELVYVNNKIEFGIKVNFVINALQQ